MFVYNYRIYDRYDKSVASFAVLANHYANWRLANYSYSLMLRSNVVLLMFVALSTAGFVGIGP